MAGSHSWGCHRMSAILQYRLRVAHEAVLPTAHSHPHYTLKKYAFYNKMYILRIISGF